MGKKDIIIGKTWTEAQEIFADNYYWGDEGIRGNAYQCYKIAYPKQSENCAIAHSSKKSKEAGVQAAMLYLKKKYDAELQEIIVKNPKIMPKEDLLMLASEMAYNEANPMTGKRKYSDNLQRYGLEIMRQVHGISNQNNHSDNVMTAIQINVNSDGTNIKKNKSDIVDEIEIKTDD